MPHLDLEYSNNVVTQDLSTLAAELHRMLADVTGVRIENCKTRWRTVPDYYLGDGALDEGFVHLTIRLLEGRTREVRRDVARSALDLLRSHLRPPHGAGCQYTVDIGEIDPSTYAKHPPGTLSTDAPANPRLETSP